MAEAHDELPSREATLFAVDRTYRIAVIGMLITVVLWIGSREADLLYGDTYDNMRVGFYEGLFIVSWRESSGGTQTGWGWYGCDWWVSSAPRIQWWKIDPDSSIAGGFQMQLPLWPAAVATGTLALWRRGVVLQRLRRQRQRGFAPILKS